MLAPLLRKGAMQAMGVGRELQVPGLLASALSTSAPVTQVLLLLATLLSVGYFLGRCLGCALWSLWGHAQGTSQAGSGLSS